MSSSRVKKVLLVVLAQLIAIFLAWVFTLPAYHIVNAILNEPKVTDVGLNISFTAAPLVGFIPAWLFFLTAAHFVIYSRLKVYYVILLLPFILLGFGLIKFLLFEVSIILTGFLLGSLIRIIFGLVIPKNLIAPTKSR